MASIQGSHPRSTIALISAAAVAVAVTLLMLPVASPARLILARVVGIVIVILATAQLRRLPRAALPVWRWIWLYLLVTVAADLVYDAQALATGEPPFPGPADVLYLSTYVFGFLALFRLTRLLSPQRDIEAWIDTALISVSSAAIVLSFVIVPLLQEAGGVTPTLVVSVAYPLLDLVLVAALARAILMPRLRNRALIVLALGMVLFLGFDLVYNTMAVLGQWDEHPLMEVVWTAAIACVGLASRISGAEHFEGVPIEVADRITPLRGLALTAAILAPTLLLRVAIFSGDLTLARWLAPGGLVVVLLMVWRMYRLLATVQSQSERLADLARTDALTGLPNRRTWDHELVRAARHARAYREPLTVALLDLDHFKGYNDSHGHQAGDRFLVECVQAWQEVLGRSGTLARYGGEEFGVLVPHLEDTDVMALLERLRTVVPGGDTVSIGASRLLIDEDPLDAVRRADFALYRAKEQGRNRVVMDDPAA